MIRCRLDRALSNEEWHSLFPYSYTDYLGMVGSDHRQVVASLDDKVPKRRGQFWFDSAGLGEMVLWNQLIEDGRSQGVRTQGILFRKLAIVGTKFLNGEIINRHMERTRSGNSNKH